MNKSISIMAALSMAAIMASCGSKQSASEENTGLNPDNFVAVVNGKPTALYTISNANGMSADITNFGARVVALNVPDRNGNIIDVVLGFDSIADYVNVPSDFGASIGRYANRIKDGRISVAGGDTIQLPLNNFGHCLHGGPTGWQYQVYELTAQSDSSLTFTIQSPDGDNNFPGNVTASVTYTITPDNTLDIAYTATTDAPTVINMTNHSYFNLSGDATTPITDHMLTVVADGYTPVDSTYMTTGEIAPVAGTPFDFTAAKPVGQDIAADNEQIRNGNGYDHNWVLNAAGDITLPAAVLYSPASGVNMEVYTDEPGIQVYSGNFLDGTVTGKNGIVYNQRSAICLETQHYPDSPNKPQWPTTTLMPGETYNSHTIYKFSTK